jgi:Na+/H+ antiporter NhaD/arsenite permease-like protein
MLRNGLAAGLFAALIALAPAPAFAAAGISGAGMSLLWVLPFAGLLLCIATGPLFFPHVWEHHYGKFSAFWAACVIVPLYLFFDAGSATAALSFAMLKEYLPFIVLLFALFTAAGGILVKGDIQGTPMVNTAILAIGTILASFVGTTGASMILIRPIIRANADRASNVHVVVFFIFLVSNCGGALTPLGDPPLFVGFLKGVEFFWTTTHLLTETIIVCGILLALFFVLDTVLFNREKKRLARKPPVEKVGLAGWSMFGFIGVVVAAILLRAEWQSSVVFHVLGIDLPLQDLVSMAIMLAAAYASLIFSNKAYREANGFNWGPILEVAKLFAGIFVCIVPVLAILAAGKQSAAAPLVALVSNADGTPNNVMFFWLTGLLSSFLDNAPTYLVFFELAGGDPQALMTKLAITLAAISTGAVYMGANTYIGNAPNFMVYAIAKDMGVKMPSFFGYMVWSGLILIPIFILVTFLFFVAGAPLAGR